jgi:hypothetical protein
MGRERRTLCAGTHVVCHGRGRGRHCMVWYPSEAIGAVRCCGCLAAGVRRLCLLVRQALDIADCVCVRGFRRDDPGKKRALVACSGMSEGISTYVSGSDSLQKSPHVPRYQCGYSSITAPRAPPSVATHGRTLSVATSGYQWHRWGNAGGWIKWCADWWVIRYMYDCYTAQKGETPTLYLYIVSS